MMGHISDRTLDNLLDGQIDDAGELAIEEHVRHCDRCAHRLREWELLFPQIKSLIPTGEHPAMAGQAAVATPHAPSVFIPDWTPPPNHRVVPTRIAWGLVTVLALGAGYLLVQRFDDSDTSTAFLPESYEVATQSAAGDSAGLGSGIPSTPAAETPAVVDTPLAKPETLVIRDSVRPEPAASVPERPRQETPPPREETSRQPVEQDVRVPTPRRETALTFPIRTDTARRAEPENTRSDPLPPLPTQFQRVTLGEAILRLNGTVRLIDGLTQEAVEIAQGSAVPGADPAMAVVRVVYNAPEGRLILDQQRLGRPGAREPSIAISTAPNGVSVAQWVDRAGFWISLAGRADQQTLLTIANRIR